MPEGFRPLTYLSVCSEIEAATVAWHPLGWKALGFAEIDKFPSAVLAHHYPEVTNYGDFTQITLDSLSSRPDILVGETPCQDFSVAGLRAGLDGARGQLIIEFVRLAERLQPKWLVWKNVPGVLSADEGRAFGTFLGALGEVGYGFAYRVLDAQYFGVPQRRRRVFLVGCLGDWRRAAAVLFERQSLQGNDSPPEQTPVSVCLTARGQGSLDDRETFVIDQDGFPRHLTPRECERLQGFPDDYTLISPKTADGPRYKALGNSMAVPCMAWIGRRLQIVDSLG